MMLEWLGYAEAGAAVLAAVETYAGRGSHDAPLKRDIGGTPELQIWQGDRGGDRGQCAGALGLIITLQVANRLSKYLPGPPILDLGVICGCTRF